APSSSDEMRPKLVARMISCGRSAASRICSESGNAPFARAWRGNAVTPAVTPTLTPPRRRTTINGARPRRGGLAAGAMISSSSVVNIVVRHQHPVLSIGTTVGNLVGHNIVPAERLVPQVNMIKIPFEKYSLPNGLTVILHQDRSSPLVAVNIWYHV